MPSIYDLDTPALLVDLDRLERNIATMARTVAAGGKLLRPHTKTHKTPEIARMQMAAGARGITVAKLGEAEVMAQAGFEDILIANQIVGPIKIARLIELLRRIRVTVGVDSAEVAGPIGEAAHAHCLAAPVYIEVDTGLGRAGARSPEEALTLAQQIADHPGLELAGIFTYERLYYPEEAARQAAATQVAEQLRSLCAKLAEQGTPALECSVGSTPGAPLMAREAGVTEIRSGVYVFSDRMQKSMGADPDACALSVLATVISVRPDGRVIVDAGVKTFASDSPFADKTYGEVIGRPDLAVIGASEEHGHIQAAGAPNLRVGDKIRLLPNHACTCVNLHEVLNAYRGEHVQAVWSIAARGKIQ